MQGHYISSVWIAPAAEPSALSSEAVHAIRVSEIKGRSILMITGRQRSAISVSTGIRNPSQGESWMTAADRNSTFTQVMDG